MKDWKVSPVQYFPERLAAEDAAEAAAHSNTDKGHTATVFVGKVPGTTHSVYVVRVGGNRERPEDVTVTVQGKPVTVAFSFRKTVNVRADKKSGETTAAALDISF